VKRERILQVAVGLLGLFYIALMYPLYTDLWHSLSGHLKTGQRRSGQNRPTSVAGTLLFLPRRFLWRQVCFCAPTAWPAFEYVSVMEQTVEHGGDSRAVAK
jgi:hypothetical protein